MQERTVVVLDLMLPGLDGLEVCRRVQKERPVPVLMLTARDSETDLLVGLAVGADDYLTKPFSPRELVARVHAILRRMERTPVFPGPGAGGSPVRVGDIEIDASSRRVHHAGEAESTRVFERFYRTDAARSTSHGGSGLGLAIARWIVDLHGGDTRAERREPHGCRMVVVLPGRAS